VLNFLYLPTQFPVYPNEICSASIYAIHVWMQPAPWMQEHGTLLLENYCTAGLATDDNTVNVHYMLDT
jgi:hypothetical protein